MMNKKKVVNTEFADYLKTKLDKNNIIESFENMKKSDPKLWQALLALEGIEKDHAQQKNYSIKLFIHLRIILGKHPSMFLII